MNWIGDVLTAKVAEVAPAGTKVLFGTAAMEKLESFAREILAPPSGAGAVSVTVPVVVSPLSIVSGLKLSEAKNGSGGTNVKVPVWEIPP